MFIKYPHRSAVFDFDSEDDTVGSAGAEPNGSRRAASGGASDEANQRAASGGASDEENQRAASGGASDEANQRAASGGASDEAESIVSVSDEDPMESLPSLRRLWEDENSLDVEDGERYSEAFWYQDMTQEDWVATTSSTDVELTQDDNMSGLDVPAEGKCSPFLTCVRLFLQLYKLTGAIKTAPGHFAAIVKQNNMFWELDDLGYETRQTRTRLRKGPLTSFLEGKVSITRGDLKGWPEAMELDELYRDPVSSRPTHLPNIKSIHLSLLKFVFTDRHRRYRKTKTGTDKYTFRQTSLYTSYSGGSKRTGSPVPSTSRCQDDTVPSTSRCQDDTVPSTSRCQDDAAPSTSRCQDDAVPSTSRCQDDAVPSTSRCQDDAVPSTSRCQDDAVPSTSYEAEPGAGPSTTRQADTAEDVRNVSWDVSASRPDMPSTSPASVSPKSPTSLSDGLAEISSTATHELLAKCGSCKNQLKLPADRTWKGRVKFFKPAMVVVEGMVVSQVAQEAVRREWTLDGDHARGTWGGGRHQHTTNGPLAWTDNL
ncbi:hypothetical protein Bbelb_035390 [Branchiostoma belcheri]|nr:hypothetical protein Bbelb_035390 [Branchiostoma belcheri]